MAKTYEPISTQTLGTATATVTFSSIPQTYTDLVVIISAASSVAQDPFSRVNGDSGTNYAYQAITGNGGSASAQQGATQNAISLNYFGSDSTTLGENARVIQFLNYSNTNMYKQIICRGGRGNTDGLAFLINTWINTAAITSISFHTGSGTYSVGSTFTLYGIKSA
jgi:hypothetical protein